jgi:hypothetical protein
VLVYICIPMFVKISFLTRYILYTILRYDNREPTYTAAVESLLDGEYNEEIDNQMAKAS